MAIVVDASVLVAAFGDDGARGSWANEAIADAERLFSPSHVFVECAHGIRRMEHDGELTILEAMIAYQEILGLNLELHPYEPYAERIWSLRHNVTPYDAWYVALAEHLGHPLVTLDRRLNRASGLECDVITLE